MNRFTVFKSRNRLSTSGNRVRRVLNDGNSHCLLVSRALGPRDGEERSCRNEVPPVTYDFGTVSGTKLHLELTLYTISVVI